MVFPYGEGIEVQPVRKFFGQGRKEQFFAILCGRSLWTAPNNDSYYKYDMCRTIGICLIKTTVAALA